MALEIVNPVEAVGAVVFFATFLGFLSWSYLNKKSLEGFSVGISYEQVFGIVLSIVPLVAGFAYLIMAFNLGFIDISGRKISFIRYFEWGISTPLLLFALAALTQKDKLIYRLVGLDVAMILTGFFASVTSGMTKMAFFALSTLVFILLLHQLFFAAKKEMEKRPESLQRIFRPLMWLTLVVWALYPFVWASSVEGFALVGFETSQLIFMALDVIAKVGYTSIVLYQLNRFSRDL